MTLEATFAVVVPAGGLSPHQRQQFEHYCVEHCIEIQLPMRTDAKGNAIVARGLTLQDAQILRRQVSVLGYSVDVISDAAAQYPHQNAQVEEPSLDTLVVELEGFKTRGDGEDAADLAADAWSSLEMDSIDLGLEAGKDADRSRWSGEHWMKLNDSSQTLSVSARQLLNEVEKATDEHKKATEKPIPVSLEPIPLVSDIQPILPQITVPQNAGFSADMAVLDVDPAVDAAPLRAQKSPPPKKSREPALLNAEDLLNPIDQNEQGVSNSSKALRIFLILVAVILSILIVLIILQFFIDMPFMRALLQ